MKLLLVAATDFEIRPFVEKLHSPEKQDDVLIRAGLGDHLLDVLVTGVGMVPTAMYLGRQYATEKYDFAINAGVAGTFNSAIPLGSVVHVTEDCIAEFGAEDGDLFTSIFDLGLLDPDTPPYRDGKLINDLHWLSSFIEIDHSNHSANQNISDPISAGEGRGEGVNHGLSSIAAMINELRSVKGISSNIIRGNTLSIEKVRRQFHPDIECMEGAAFFYATFMAGIPCIQVRAISNLVEKRDKSRWNMDLALQNLNQFLENIFSKIN